MLRWWPCREETALGRTLRFNPLDRKSKLHDQIVDWRAELMPYAKFWIAEALRFSAKTAALTIGRISGFTGKSFVGPAGKT